jgi:hypothetical protein
MLSFTHLGDFFSHDARDVAFVLRELGREAVANFRKLDRKDLECPTGSGRLMNLFEGAREIADRLTRIFLRDERGRRPVYGGSAKFQSDPHWRDHLLFYEYFHGDNGAGLGASHQTGWTGLVATVIQLFGRLDGPQLLEGGRAALFGESRSGT